MGKATQQDFQNRVAKQGWYVGVGSFMQFLDFYDTNQISFKYIQLISKVIPEHHWGKHWKTSRLKNVSTEQVSQPRCHVFGVAPSAMDFIQLGLWEALVQLKPHGQTLKFLC